MPSTSSSSFSSPLPSSTVITPSLPTLSIASAIVLPIDSSALAEIAPTCAISLLVVQGLLIFLSSSTTAITALSMPRLRSIGFMPAATYFMPSLTIDCASTVAVVVPSPATSEVLDATSLTICAPMFSNLSFNSISLATDTPSLVIVGAPKLRSSTTLRPFGPSVTLTALARMFTPLNILLRTPSPKRTSLAAIFVAPQSQIVMLTDRRSALGDDADDVVFAHVQQVLPVHLEFLAGVLAEEDLVAGLHAHGDDLAALVGLAGTHVQDLALRRLLGRRIGDDDAARRLAFFLQPLDDHTIVQRTNLHVSTHSMKKVYES